MPSNALLKVYNSIVSPNLITAVLFGPMSKTILSRKRFQTTKKGQQGFFEITVTLEHLPAFCFLL
jgi:hypothetical protein